MLPPRLAKEIDELRQVYEVEVIDESAIFNVIINGFPTGPLYNSPTTLLLLRVPRAYPDAAMDMFWTDPSLTLADGTIPQAGECIECYAGRSWRRFSWHHNGWQPSLQTLTAYLEFVRRRFHAR